MESSKFCKQCHKPVPETAPEGLCPECLAKVGLGSEPAAPGGRTAPDPSQLAEQFPQLEILELLGIGGMGIVYKARQPRLDRIVALKILQIEPGRDPTFAERFEREARALARLNHPGIVAVYDFGQTKDFYFFVMEYVEGMNLRQLLRAEPISAEQTLDLISQVCAALQYAHGEKIVHRDIKPENILINTKGQAKIADFGLAKLMGNAPDIGLTATQAVMGTAHYMAPEQRAQPLAVDHRADIYSLGVVFYEMLTGEVPMGRFEPPSKRVRVDVRLDEVVLHALEREPARRYQNAGEIKTGVETIAATMKPSGGQERGIRPASVTWPRYALPAGIAILVLILGFFALDYIRMAESNAALQQSLRDSSPAPFVPATTNDEPPLTSPRLNEAVVPAKLKFVSVDSEEASARHGYGEYAVDGNPDTVWETEWKNRSPRPPHEIIIELVPPSIINGFTYLPRQDESDHGIIRNYEFYVSNDGKDFGEPVRKGTFKLGRETKTETFEPVKCRFIKLRALLEINGLAWTSAAEIGVVQGK